MNRDVDPCEDFSQFVCGKFYQDDNYPEDYSIAWDWAFGKSELGSSH